MSKRFMLLTIFINLLLTAVYIISSVQLWEEMNNWYDYNMQSTWTPFYVYPHRISGLPTVMMPVPPMLNLPFIIFLVSIITNLVLLLGYFVVIPLLQRWANKEI
jgi:hypothetical protein